MTIDRAVDKLAIHVTLASLCGVLAGFMRRLGSHLSLPRVAGCLDHG